MVNAPPQQAKASPAPRPPAPPEVPQTRDELEALAAKRGELIDQLESVTDRREELANQLSDAHGAARPGLEARIRTLDERSARLEQEILLADDAIATAAASGIAVDSRHEVHTTVQPREDVVSKDFMANALFFEAVAFVLLGILLYRWTWKRARATLGGGAGDQSGRLDQLQHSIDAIALEVERISENQRYLTRSIGDGFQPAVGAGVGQEVPVHRKTP
jgi:hypothetical protein